MEDVFKFINILNKYINDSAPWKLNADDPEQKRKMLDILRTASVSIYYISYLIYPFMPETSRKINAIFNIAPFDAPGFSAGAESIRDVCAALFKDGLQIVEKAEIMFPNINTIL